MFVHCNNVCIKFDSAEIRRLNRCRFSVASPDTACRTCTRNAAGDSDVTLLPCRTHFKWVRHGRSPTFESGLGSANETAFSWRISYMRKEGKRCVTSRRTAAKDTGLERDWDLNPCPRIALHCSNWALGTCEFDEAFFTSCGPTATPTLSAFQTYEHFISVW